MKRSLIIWILLLLFTLFPLLGCGKKAPPRLPLIETSVSTLK